MNFWVSAVALPVAVSVSIIVLFYPSIRGNEPEPMVQTVAAETVIVEPISSKVQAYLESKQSPLASDAEFLVEHLEHWKLLIAISAIESQYCIRQLGHNCWGVGGDASYRHYSSFRVAALDANDLISSWQRRGRWLTVEDMNCHYVVPCNPNWVYTVNLVLSELNALGTSTPNTSR